MKRTCCTHKQAQFVCVNEFCKQKCSYVCSIINDPCKEQHQSCSLVSLNFLNKKFTKISNRQKLLNMKQLQKLYDESKKLTKRLEMFFQQRQNALKMKDILDPHGLFQQTQKNILVEFIKSQQKIKNASDQESLLSVVTLEKQLFKLNLQINNYLKYLKEANIQNASDKKSEVSSPLKAQGKLVSSKVNEQKRQGSAIDKIRSHSKGPTPVKSGNIFDPDDSPIKLSQTKKVTNPSMISNNSFQPKLSSTIKGHVPLGPLFSNITNNIQTLQSFFYQKFNGANLLYRASENQFLVSKFHQKCDGKFNTLTILITEYDKIIGGFTPLQWKSNGQWYDDDTESSFLFSLNLGERFSLKTKSKAIWCNQGYGPSFGYPDLEIANKAFYNQNSCVNFPQFYNNGNYQHSPSSIQLFCGSKTGRFRIKQWQVYELEF